MLDSDSDTSDDDAPCHDRTQCRNVEARCWFAAVMTFVYKAYDALPKSAPLLPSAFSFAEEMFAACSFAERRALVCKRVPPKVMDAYKRYLWEHARMVPYSDSTFKALLDQDSPAHDQEFWRVLFLSALKGPVLMNAELVDPSADGATFTNVRLGYTRSGKHHEIVADARFFNTPAALYHAAGYVPYYTPGDKAFGPRPAGKETGIAFYAAAQSANAVQFEVTAGNAVGAENMGYAELLLASIFDISIETVARGLGAVDALEPLHFSHGVAMIAFTGAAVNAFPDFVAFVDALAGHTVMENTVIVGGLITLDAAHTVSFVVCDDASVMVCDPDYATCDIKTSGWAPRGCTFVHIVVVHSSASKRIRLGARFVDMAAA